MPIDSVYFRNYPEEAQLFLQGRDGVILSAVAVASACTNRKLIAGHFVFGGPELQRSSFLVHPNYQKFLDDDIHTRFLVSLAPFLAEYELLGQSNYERHRAAIAEASRAFGTNYYIDVPDMLVQRIVAMIANGENLERYENFLALLNDNYDIVHQAIESDKYNIGENYVIPSTILKPFCGTSLSDRLGAMHKTRPRTERLKALDRFAREIQMMEAE